MAFPFMTCIAMETDSFVSSKTIVSFFLDEYPKFHIESVGTAEKGEAIMLTVGNVPISIMQIPFPIPTKMLKQVLTGNQIQAKTKTLIRHHQAHLVVTALATAEDLEETIALARCVTVISSVLCRMVPALGVYWSAGDVFSSAKDFTDIEKLTIKGNIPIEQWVQFFSPKMLLSDTTKPIFSATTNGLLPFIGRELEFQSPTKPVDEIIRILEDLTLFCLEQKTVINDGDIFFDEQQDIHAHFVNEGLRPGIPIVHLSIEPSSSKG